MPKQEYKNTQIIRKDARNCFVETKSDCFNIGKVVLNFVQYDASKPEGNRANNSVSIFMPVDDMLFMCAEISGGTLAQKVEQKRSKNDMKPIYQHLGGQNADKAKRPDKMSLSRNVTLTVGRSALFFTAESGPGEVSGTGIIVPKYSKPEQRVSVSITYDEFAKLMLMTKSHYDAWLATKYAKEA
ncbi:MAG: hypothetical protein IJZ68_07225 [Bacteroidaceae bacterium]|nr:hypothetical protein [Bacteroidaceae bacterium]